MRDKVTSLSKDLGLYDIGFFIDEDSDLPFPYGIVLFTSMSDGVVDEIEDAPTYNYFHHYRTQNAYLDQVSLRIGRLLEDEGYRYLPIPASQSMAGMAGRYSHKRGAVLAGKGGMGKNALFLHERRGPRVRIATILTDCIFPAGTVATTPCTSCDLCVKACPSGALLGGGPSFNRGDMVDPLKCSDHMKRAYKNIGRGAVCGICMRVCPIYKKAAEL